MRTWAILGAILIFLTIWSGCTCKHEGAIAALAARYGASPSATPHGAVVAERASLGVALSGDRLTLSGVVPSEEAKAKLLAEAKRLYGEASVVDSMTIAPDGKAVPDGWLKGALGALPWAKTVRFTAGERTMTLQGSVPTDKIKSDTLALATKELGAGWTIDDRLHVGAGGVAKGILLAQAREGKVALSGTLPSSEARDALKLAVEKRLGANNFTEELKVADKTATVDPEWIAIAEKAAVWGKIAPVSLENETATLRGELPSEAARSARYEYVRKTLGAGWNVVDAMTVKPSATPDAARDEKANDTTSANLDAFKGVEFETGSSALTDRGKILLDGAARVMQSTGATRYEIAGHTDARGNETMNLRLSEERAKAVLRYLVEKGVDEARLEAEGYGAARPIASNDTAADRSRNRRIEFTELK